MYMRMVAPALPVPDKRKMMREPSCEARGQGSGKGWTR